MTFPARYLLNFVSPIIALTALNALVLAGGAWVTWALNDPHSLARTGAAIAAVSGMFVVWQVAVELRETATSEAVAPENLATMPALDRQAERLRIRRAHVRHRQTGDRRLKLVLAIAVWITTGELLHGFGDMVAVRFGLASHSSAASRASHSATPAATPSAA